MNVNTDKNYFLVSGNLTATAKIDNNYIESEKKASVIRYKDRF